MNKDKQTMEALLRHKLGEYTLPVEEQEWQDFLTFAAKKKSRRGGIWWVLALILTGCTGLFAYHYAQQVGSDEVTHSSFVTTSEPESKQRLSELNTPSMAEAKQAESDKALPAAQAQSSFQAPSSISSSPSPRHRATTSPSPNGTLSPSVSGTLPYNEASERSRHNLIALQALFRLSGQIQSPNPELQTQAISLSNKPKRDKRPPFPIHTRSVYFAYSQVIGTSPWSIENGGEDYVHREFAAALSEHSMAISGQGFELGFRLPLSRFFTVSGGLEYASRTQKSDFTFLSTEFPVVDTANRIVAYIPNLQDTLIQVGMNQSYSAISLPIQIQLAKRITTNLNIGLKAGIQFSRFQSDMQEQVNPLTFEPSQAGKTIRTFGMSYAAGLFAEYRFLRDWGFLLSVDRRFYQPIYQSDEFINTTPKLTDFRFSLIRYL